MRTQTDETEWLRISNLFFLEGRGTSETRPVVNPPGRTSRGGAVLGIGELGGARAILISRGRDHLQRGERSEALARRADLYARHGSGAVLRIDGGRIAVRSLQVPGMGFAALPSMDAMATPQQWLRDYTDDAKLGLAAEATRRADS